MIRKAQLVWSELGRWIIILAGAAIVILFITSLMTGRLPAAIQGLIDMLRFGR